jgi:RNA polymerase sigma-70 factor (ECF subfamily)
VTSFNEIYDKYFKDVYRYILSLSRNSRIAEDITQETFIKAFKCIDSFKGNCKLQVWLCQIAKNTYYSYYKKEKIYDYSFDDEKKESSDNLENRLMSNEEAFEIYRAIHNLEEPYKEVFTLRVFGEVSFAQIAKLFEKTESWARVTYYRAKIKIKEGLL